MDRVSWIGTVVCIAAFVGFYLWQDKTFGEPERRYRAEAAEKQRIARLVAATNGPVRPSAPIVPPAAVEALKKDQAMAQASVDEMARQLDAKTVENGHFRQLLAAAQTASTNTAVKPAARQKATDEATKLATQVAKRDADLVDDRARYEAAQKSLEDTKQKLAAATAPVQPSFTAAPGPSSDLPDEEYLTLENDDVLVKLTNRGGAIANITLKKHMATGTSPIVLNQNADEGILNTEGWGGGDNRFLPLAGKKIEEPETPAPAPDAPPATLKYIGRDAVVYTGTGPGGVEITRKYRLAENYQVSLEQTVRNPAAAGMDIPPYQLNVGTAGPIHLHDNVTYTGASWMSDVYKFHKMTVSEFHPFSVLGMTFSAAKTNVESDIKPLIWSATFDQFFTVILTAPKDQLIDRCDAQPVKIPWTDYKNSTPGEGVKLESFFNGYHLDPAQTRTETYMVYAGPKEYSRLSELPQQQDHVMDYGIWGLVIVPLLNALRFIHGFVPNWGVAIIILTLCIKAAFWPLQTRANRSMKKVQALAPKLKELRDRYEKDPTKLNNETIKLYKEYGVNPVGGCLPLLPQMPVFIGFYIMLQSAGELRGQTFLWIHDLTQPDTVAQIPGIGIDINPMPMIMTCTAILLMRMTPTGDNQQAKVMQFMPLILLFMLYNFASALALYWTVSNLVSMLQTYINLRRPMPELKRLPKA